MRIFLTGATGFIGPALIEHLSSKGHEIVGLARSRTAEHKLRSLGARPIAGSILDLDILRRGAADADGVIHLAYSFSPSDLSQRRLFNALLGGWPGGIVGRMMHAITATNNAAVDALAGALSGSGRPMVTAFATMGVASAPGNHAERCAIETDAPDCRSPGHVRAVSEALVKQWAGRGVRASIVRLAPSVHGRGDSGLIPQLATVARKHGEVLYVGDGSNRWSGVHIGDAVSLFELVLEKGRYGGVYHGAVEEGVDFRLIAEIMARRLGLRVRSATPIYAKRQLGFLAPFVAVDNPVDSQRTRQELGWQPFGPTLIDDLEGPDYFG
ncbi:SDR family oxidoreductase [Agrobacterium sp. SORGH_AS 787]|uniref:SDR family oxidoreductase n=1 Tax=Agrobacterium sp. SORGH_AS 787 TaxID=3041775 RepID=UPI002780647D|nr:nucleoside-diphosphate-sugar epimerase [Rhizobium sp. SORGH_AS_0787]